MVSIICYTNNTRTLEHSYFTSSQLLRQDNSPTTIFQSTDDVLSGSFYLVCTQQVFKKINILKSILTILCPNELSLALCQRCQRCHLSRISMDKFAKVIAKPQERS